MYELMNQTNRVIYAKLYLLDKNEKPFETIEGKVATGSINIDGSQSQRRTCNLTISVENKYNSTYIKKAMVEKMQFFIGLLDEKTNEIQWFNQGIFLIKSLSINTSGQKTSVSVSGLDKMANLNGTINGSFLSQTRLDILEIEQEDGSILEEKIPIKDIIYNLLYEMAQELPQNIIINDLDESAYELWQYNGSTNFYILYQTIEEKNVKYCIPVNYTTKGDLRINDTIISALPPYPGDDAIDYSETYYVKTFFPGDWVGYHPTPLIYPGELIAKAGESIVSVLDKIKNVLSQFEYYYDENGKFIFQKQPYRLALETDSLINGKLNIKDNLNSTVFNNEKLIKSVSYSINLDQVKNDFSAWGSRTSVSGAQIDIHSRYAIDRKPSSYTRFEPTDDDITWLKIKYPEQYPKDIEYYKIKENDPIRTFKKNTFGSKSSNTSIQQCDWREIIYQMASDYFKYHLLPDFNLRLEQNNPDMLKGITGYEQYYTDIAGFWRQLYDPNKTISYSLSTDHFKKRVDAESYYFGIKIGEQVEDYFDEEITPSVYFYDDINLFKTEEEYKKAEFLNPYIRYYLLTDDILKDLGEKVYFGEDKETQQKGKEKFLEIVGYTLEQYYSITSKSTKIALLGENQKTALKDYILQDINKYQQVQNYDDDGWHLNVKNSPDLLNFWFDFIDPIENSYLQDFSVKEIGQRSKVDSGGNKKASVIIPIQAPRLLLLKPKEEIPTSGGYENYPVLRLDNVIIENFTIASNIVSCVEKVSELLNKHTQMISGVSITSIPIYNIIPNMKISFNNPSSGIVGNFYISKYNMPLTYNGTMNITANQIYDNMEVSVDYANGNE